MVLFPINNSVGKTTGPYILIIQPYLIICHTYLSDLPRMCPVPHKSYHLSLVRVSPAHHRRSTFSAVYAIQALPERQIKYVGGAVRPCSPVFCLYYQMLHMYTARAVSHCPLNKRNLSHWNLDSLCQLFYDQMSAMNHTFQKKTILFYPHAFAHMHQLEK